MLLSEWTSEQWGMVTAGQARRAGVSRVDLNRLIADGILDRVDDADGVYRLTGAQEDPELDPLRAAWLQLGEGRSWSERVRRIDAVVSHRSAAHARGLGDLIPAEHEFYVDRRRRPARDDVRLRVRTGMRMSWATWQGLPVCTVEQIVADLLADHEDESAVATICRDAVRDGLTSRDQLLPAVGSATRGSASRLVDRLLKDAA
jgi:hypothetical protein